MDFIRNFMYCPFCDYKESKVLESRLTSDKSIRRRRKCENCDKRFTTYERNQGSQFLIVKRSGSREPYSRDKLQAGLTRAITKTTVTAAQIDELVDSIENEIIQLGNKEITSQDLGDLALNKLKLLNQVAYVRFASVYRQFQSIEDFIAELHKLQISKFNLEILNTQ